MNKYIILIAIALFLISFDQTNAAQQVRNTWGGSSYYANNTYNTRQTNRNSWGTGYSRSNPRNTGLFGFLGTGGGLFGVLSTNSYYRGPTVVW